MPGAGIPDSERVVNIYHWPPQRGAQSPRLSWPDAEELRANVDLFVDLVAWARLDKPVTGMGRFQMADGELVSSNYFAFVGAQPVIGRVLQPSDHLPAAVPVAVISEQLWRSNFGASPETIGRSFQIGHQPFTIVGVVNNTFRGLDLPNIQPTKLWIPIEFAEAVGILSPNGWINADERWVMVKAKLTEGVTAAAAQSRVTTLAHQLDRIRPIGRHRSATSPSPGNSRRFVLEPLNSVHIHESIDWFALPFSKAMTGLSWLVLLIACSNVAGMTIAANGTRAREIALRQALGAPRWRILGVLVWDASVITVAGAALGLIVTALIGRLADEPIQLGPVASLDLTPTLVDTAVLIAAGGAVGLAALLAALVPAWRSSRVAPMRLLKSAEPGNALGWRGQRTLLAAQITLSMAFLAVATSLAHELRGRVIDDVGFALTELAAAHIDFSLLARDWPPELLSSVASRLTEQPAIVSAAVLDGFPIYFPGATAVYVGREATAPASIAEAMDLRSRGRLAYLITGSSTLVETLGLQLTSGRTFSDAQSGAQSEVVISETVRSTNFGAEPAVGSIFFIGRQALRVVGVVEDTDWNRLGDRSFAFVYRVGHLSSTDSQVLVVRSGDPEAALRSIERELTSVDQELPVVNRITGRAIAQQQTLLETIAVRVSVALGGLGLVLALGGLVGVAWCLVNDRRKEMAVRVSLGARIPHLLALMVRRAALPLAIGVLAGVALGILASSLITTQMYRHDPGDLPWLELLCLPLIGWVGIIAACYRPAVRAGTIDPIAELRI